MHALEGERSLTLLIRALIPYEGPALITQSKPYYATKLKANDREASVIRKERYFRNVFSLGTRWTYVPRPTLKILLSPASWKERISVNNQDKRLDSASFSAACRLADSFQTSFCLHDLPAGLLKGLLRVES